MAGEATQAATPSTMLSVPITKGKGTIEIDTASIPEDVYAEALLQGLKVLLNRGTSKVTKETWPNEEELKAKAMEVAQEQLQLVMTSKIKFTGAPKAKTKESGKVMTEARRLARNVVKDAIKAQGGKISHYEAKDITAAANELLKNDPSLVEQAKANLEALEKTPSHTVDIKSLISVSAKKVAQAEEKKAKEKANAPLSAKQAGKTAKRKPGPQVQA
jgi:hypothetical protein